MPALATGAGGMHITHFAQLLADSAQVTQSGQEIELYCWTGDDFSAVKAGLISAGMRLE